MFYRYHGNIVQVIDTTQSSVGIKGGITFKYLTGPRKDKINGYSVYSHFFELSFPIEGEELKKLKLEFL